MAEGSGGPAVLGRIARDLEQLRIDAEVIGQPLLASLLELAKAEAEDASRTATFESQVASELKQSSIATDDLEAELKQQVLQLKRAGSV
jgi:hypothetical protein